MTRSRQALMAAAFLAPALLAPSAARAGEGSALAARLAEPGTHTLVSLDIGFADLAALIGASIDPSYAGSVPDPTDLLKDDRADWTVNTAPVSVSGTSGGLDMRTSASGAATVRGKFGIRPLQVNVRETLTVAARIHATMRPAIRSDWGIDANAAATVTRDEAYVRIVGQRISLRGKLPPAVQNAANDAVNRFAARLSEPAFLKEKAEEAWSQMCRTISIPAGSGTTTMHVRPRSVAIASPATDADSLRITLVITSDLALVSDGSAPSCDPLPAQLAILD